MVCSCAYMFEIFLCGATKDYKISNSGLTDFIHAYYCDFLNNMYRQGSVFSCGKG